MDFMKKGIGYMKLAFEKSTIDEERIEKLIVEHRNSKTVEWMRIGDNYYSVDNDILTKSDTKKTYQANSKLAHTNYKSMVDEKIGYLFSKDSSIHAESDETTNVIVDKLGDNFNYDLES